MKISTKLATKTLAIIAPAAAPAAAAPAVELSAIPAVVTALKAANTGAGTLVRKAKEAAKLAAGQLDPSIKDIDARIKRVIKAYAVDLAGMDANVKAVFSNALTLLAAGSTPVSITVKEKGVEVEKHLTAETSLDLSKHDLAKAAKQARAAHGVGRAAGAGRPTKTPSTTKQDTEQMAFAAWLDNMEPFIGNPIREKKILAKLKELGYKVTK